VWFGSNRKRALIALPAAILSSPDCALHRRRPVKLLIFIIFALGMFAAIAWNESAKHQSVLWQKQVYGMVSIVALLLVIVLGSTML
jgi:hypothetical protein